MTVRRSPLDLTITATTGKPFIPYLRRHLVAAHALLRPPLVELSLALVGDKRMADLHLRFLNLPGPTDVLTFPLELDRRGRRVGGEVVVCVPEARRRSRQEGTELRRELLLYALHGLLHLSGYDDQTDSGFAAMHRTEDSILTRLGIGPVFSAGREPAGREPAGRSLGAPGAPRTSRTSRGARAARRAD